MAIRIVLLQLAAAALPLTAASAQPAPPDPAAARPLPPAPDPTALELARIVLLSLGPPPSATGDADRERRLEELLLSRFNPERPCDRNDPACRAAAQAIARQFAPVMHRAEQDLNERRLAYRIADRLRPDQLAATVAYLRTEEGRVFIEAWRTMLTPVTLSRWRAIECRLSETAPNPYGEARALFRQRTADLARTREAPPLIVPPTPPSPCSSGETP